MQPDTTQEAVQLLLLDRLEATQYLLDLLAVDGEHLPDQLLALTSQADQLGPQVLRRTVADDQADPLQPVDDAGNARRPDQQTVAQVGQPQPGQPFQLGP